MSRKLEPSLVPVPLWGKSLAHYLPNWSEVSRAVCSCGCCAICDTRTPDLHAHEVWSYNDELHLVNLDDIIPVCENCHNVIHYGKAQLEGKERQAKAWYCQVNGVSLEDANLETRLAYIEWEMRSGCKEWKFSGNLGARVEQVTGVSCNYKTPATCYLNVPFEEKEQAKALGARWDSARKMWFVPREVVDTPDGYAKFARWGIPDDDISKILNEAPEPSYLEAIGLRGMS